MDEVSLYSPEAKLALCYPVDSRECTRRLSILEILGVSKLCSLGPVELPGSRLRVLGKGHASVVVAGLMDDVIVAIKARRVDGKRESLIEEARFLEEASRAGVAPRPIYYDRDLIVMEAVIGPRLEDLLELATRETWVVVEALRASRVLDALNILHLELSRPWRNMLYTGDVRGSKALIVDYESARRGCGNVLSLVGGLTRLPHLGSLARSSSLREYAKTYRVECREDIYKQIENMVAKTLEENLGSPE